MTEREREIRRRRHRRMKRLKQRRREMLVPVAPPIEVKPKKKRR